jgi:hypothetical protein
MNDAAGGLDELNEEEAGLEIERKAERTGTLISCPLTGPLSGGL